MFCMTMAIIRMESLRYIWESALKQTGKCVNSPELLKMFYVGTFSNENKIKLTHAHAQTRMTSVIVKSMYLFCWSLISEWLQ